MATTGTTPNPMNPSSGDPEPAGVNLDNPEVGIIDLYCDVVSFPELGGGGVPNSFQNTHGVVNVNYVTVSHDIDGTIDWYIEDYGTKEEIEDGSSSCTDKQILINVPAVQLITDEVEEDGSMDVTVTLQQFINGEPTAAKSFTKNIPNPVQPSVGTPPPDTDTGTPPPGSDATTIPPYTITTPPPVTGETTSPPAVDDSQAKAQTENILEAKEEAKRRVVGRQVEKEEQELDQKRVQAEAEEDDEKVLEERISDLNKTRDKIRRRQRDELLPTLNIFQLAQKAQAATKTLQEIENGITKDPLGFLKRWLTEDIQVYEERIAELRESDPATTVSSTAREINSLLTSNLPIAFKLDMSGISVKGTPYPSEGYQKALTLISPIHFIMSKHFQERFVLTDPAGRGREKVQFRDKDNNLLDRTITGIIELDGVDTSVGILDSPVENVTIYSVPEPKDRSSYLNILRGSYAVSIDQEGKEIPREISNITDPNQKSDGGVGIGPGEVTFIEIPDNIDSFRESLVAGDSSSPSFIYTRNQPILIETHHTSKAGPFYGLIETQRKINEAMKSLSVERNAANYVLQTVKVSTAVAALATTPPPFKRKNTAIATTPSPETGGTTPSPETGGTTPSPETGGTTPSPAAPRPKSLPTTLQPCPAGKERINGEGPCVDKCPDGWKRDTEGNCYDPDEPDLDASDSSGGGNDVDRGWPGRIVLRPDPLTFNDFTYTYDTTTTTSTTTTSTTTTSTTTYTTPYYTTPPPPCTVTTLVPNTNVKPTKLTTTRSPKLAPITTKPPIITQPPKPIYPAPILPLQIPFIMNEVIVTTTTITTTTTPPPIITTAPATTTLCPEDPDCNNLQF